MGMLIEGKKTFEDDQEVTYSFEWPGADRSGEVRSKRGRDAYACVPVSNSVVDYEEYYELAKEKYDAYLADPDTAVPFVDECRRRQHDALLFQKPGWNRGTPTW